MLGLYPVVTQPVYLLSSPWFPDVNITLAANATLRVTATGLGVDSYYVQRVRVNGVEWAKNWIGHEDIEGGGLVEFELGCEERVWEREEAPPSPGRREG